MMQYKNGYGGSKNAPNKAMDVGKKTITMTIAWDIFRS